MSIHPEAPQRKETISPQPGPQTAFLSSPADIVIYGGAAGGGKTFGLLLEPLRHVGNPGFGGVVFRRVMPDIRLEGALWDNSCELYPLLGAKPREQQLDWTFPSGASVSFDALQYDKDVLSFQGAQICYLAFDELTHFTRRQFWYLVSRNRSVCGVRPYIRATLNPDPDSWVFDLLGPWVDESHEKYPTGFGDILWLRHVDDEYRWFDEPVEDAKSVTFIRADVYDNQKLLEKDPGYLINLKNLDHGDRLRLLEGRWSAIQAKGALWQRTQIDRDRLPVGGEPDLERIVVGLDPSASAGPDSDEAGIVVVGKQGHHFYTLDDRSGILTPKEWATRAISCFYRWKAACIVAESNNGGEMVKTVIHSIDPNVPVVLVHAKVGKKVRAEPVAALAEAGRDHHVGIFKALEGQLTRWEPKVSTESPDRLDAKVYAIMELDPTLAKDKKKSLRSNRGGYV